MTTSDYSDKGPRELAFMALLQPTTSNRPDLHVHARQRSGKNEFQRFTQKRTSVLNHVSMSRLRLLHAACSLHSADGQTSTHKPYTLNPSLKARAPS